MAAARTMPPTTAVKMWARLCNARTETNKTSGHSWNCQRCRRNSTASDAEAHRDHAEQRPTSGDMARWDECVYCSSDSSCNAPRVAGALVATALSVSSTSTPTPTPPMTTTALIADRACKASNVPASTPAAAKGIG